MAPRPFVLRLQRDLGGYLEAPVWPDGVTCRTLNVADRKQADARAVHAVLAGGYWEGGSGAPEYRKWWSGLKRDREFDPLVCFLAVDGEGVVGVAQCWTSGFVKDLAVLPRGRRRGVARALMLTVFAAFRARGSSTVSLKTREENAPARRLYESLGMIVTERGPG